MTVRKLSISVPPEIAELIKEAAAEEGKSVSAWVATAAAEQAQRARKHAEAKAAAQEMVAEYEAEFGKIPEEDRLRARQFMLESGLLDEPWPAAG